MNKRKMITDLNIFYRTVFTVLNSDQQIIAHAAVGGGTLAGWLAGALNAQGCTAFVKIGSPEWTRRRGSVRFGFSITYPRALHPYAAHPLTPYSSGMDATPK